METWGKVRNDFSPSPVRGFSAASVRGLFPHLNCCFPLRSQVESSCRRPGVFATSKPRSGRGNQGKEEVESLLREFFCRRGYQVGHPNKHNCEEDQNWSWRYIGDYNILEALNSDVGACSLTFVITLSHPFQTGLGALPHSNPDLTTRIPPT